MPASFCMKMRANQHSIEVQEMELPLVAGSGSIVSFYMLVNRHGFSPYALQTIAPKPLQLHSQAFVQCVSKILFLQLLKRKQLQDKPGH